MSRISIIVVTVIVFFMSITASAKGVDEKYPVVKGFFPNATSFGSEEGTPPSAPVYNGKKIIGYVFESKLVAPVPAYSGEPINILEAIDMKGNIVGTKVLEQHEPILLVGIPVQRLYDFIKRYIGHSVKDNIVVGGGGGEGSVNIDAISSATVTSMAVNQTIMNAAVKIAISKKIVSASEMPSAVSHATIKKDYYRHATWKSLRGNGAIRELRITKPEIKKAFKGQKGMVVDDVTRALAQTKSANDTFINMYYMDMTPPTVGRNLVGDSAYKDLMSKLKPGDEAIAVVANGVYSFKGVGYVRGGLFDRVHVEQDSNLILFHDYDYIRLIDTQLKGMPKFEEMAIFIIRHAYNFDPGKPWTLQLLVRREIGPVKSIYTTFSGGYQTPNEYIKRPPSQGPAWLKTAPLWAKVWYQRRFEIAVLAIGLTFLTFILAFQDWLVKRPNMLERMRIIFLIYTAVFIGWYGLAQLSVVNVLTFIGAVLHGFHWSTFLIDPLIFVLWVYVAMTLLLVGRGVYCGWLCPFGALQSLINKFARFMKVPQFEFPAYVHERLWAIKYLILLVLFGISLQSVNMAERFAEVEPFKTAIDLHFMRSFAFVAYALGLLVVSAFNSKFYCKYGCPLGGGLAIAGRLRLFEWLRRRRECGRPCQICANECEVQAINPIGHINYNECHYCLDCQVTYWNDNKCPPVVAKKRKIERAKVTKT